jgi:hypothetical protein
MERVLWSVFGPSALGERLLMNSPAGDFSR